MWIRVVLVVAVGGTAVLMLKGHRGARHQAIRRLLLLGFMLVAGLSVLFPQAWQHAAEALGVGRGTDLLLYALIVAFLGFVATSYLRFRDLQHQVTELSRRLALDEAPHPAVVRAEAVRQAETDSVLAAREAVTDELGAVPPVTLTGRPLTGPLTGPLTEAEPLDQGLVGVPHLVRQRQLR